MSNEERILQILLGHTSRFDKIDSDMESFRKDLVEVKQTQAAFGKDLAEVKQTQVAFGKDLAEVKQAQVAFGKELASLKTVVFSMQDHVVALTENVNMINQKLDKTISDLHILDIMTSKNTLDISLLKAIH